MESRSLNNILAVSAVPLLAVVAASAAVAGGGRDFDVPTRLCAAALAVLLAVYVAWVAWRDTFRMIKVALVASMMLAFWPLMAFDGALAVVVVIAPIAGLGVGYAVIGRRSQVRSVLLARDPRTLDAEGVFFHCVKVVPGPDGVHLELALENGGQAAGRSCSRLSGRSESRRSTA